MNNSMLKRLLSIFIALLLFFYIGYQIYSANYSTVRTETALSKTEADTIETTGIAIRKESLIEQPANGVVAYAIEDGGHIHKGGTVAVTYANEADATAQRRLQELDSEIEKLQKLNAPGDTYAANPDSLNKQINQELTDLLIASRQEGLSGLSEYREEFLYLLNEKQIVTEKVTDFNARISTLQAERQSIASSHGTQTGSIASPASGYFISHVDGYEGVFDYDQIEDITPEEIREKMAMQVTPSASIGKVCGDFNWYFVCVVDADTALKFQEKANQTSYEARCVTLTFPFASAEPLPAEVVKVNQKDKESEGAVVMRCNNMNASLARLRNETVQIEIEEYDGIRVSQKSVHFETITKETYDKDGNVNGTVTKEVKGVYVMHGSEIQFCQIFPLYSTNSYVICEVLTTEEENSRSYDPFVQDDTEGDGTQQEEPVEGLFTDRTVHLYDEVVVEGTDLYDGKVVEGRAGAALPRSGRKFKAHPGGDRRSGGPLRPQAGGYHPPCGDQDGPGGGHQPWDRAWAGSHRGEPRAGIVRQIRRPGARKNRRAVHRPFADEQGEVSDRKGQHDPVGGQHEAGAGDFPVERPGTSNNGRPGGGQHRPGGEQIGSPARAIGQPVGGNFQFARAPGARIDGDPTGRCR